MTPGETWHRRACAALGTAYTHPQGARGNSGPGGAGAPGAGGGLAERAPGGRRRARTAPPRGSGAASPGRGARPSSRPLSPPVPDDHQLPEHVLRVRRPHAGRLGARRPGPGARLLPGLREPAAGHRAPRAQLRGGARGVRGRVRRLAGLRQLRDLRLRGVRLLLAGKGRGFSETVLRPAPPLPPICPAHLPGRPRPGASALDPAPQGVRPRLCASQPGSSSTASGRGWGSDQTDRFRALPISGPPPPTELPLPPPPVSPFPLPVPHHAPPLLPSPSLAPPSSSLVFSFPPCGPLLWSASPPPFCRPPAPTCLLRPRLPTASFSLLPDLPAPPLLVLSSHLGPKKEFGAGVPLKLPRGLCKACRSQGTWGGGG